MKIRSRLLVNVFCFLFFSGIATGAFLMDIINTASFKKYGLWLFGIGLYAVLFLIATICSLTVTITATHITTRRWGRIKWELEKTDILKIECANYQKWNILLAADFVTEVRIYLTEESKHKLLALGFNPQKRKNLCFSATKREIDKMREMGFEIIDCKPHIER